MTKKKSKKTVSTRGFTTVSTPSKTNASNSNPAIIETHSNDDAPVQNMSNQDPLTNTEGESGSTAINDRSQEEIVEPDEATMLAKRLSSLNELKSSALLNNLLQIPVNISPDPRVFTLPEQLEEELLQIAKDSNSNPLSLSKCLLPNKTDQKNQHNTIAKLDTIYRALEMLGFDKRDIDKSFEASISLKIADHLDWLCLNVSYERLPHGFFDKYHTEERLSIKLDSYADAAVKTSSDFTDVPADTTCKEKPPQGQPGSILVSKHKVDDTDEDYKARILEAAVQYEEEEEEVNEKHAKIRVEMTELESKLPNQRKGKKNKQTADQPLSTAIQEMQNHIKELKQTLSSLESDWSFDKEKADKLYINQRQKAVGDRRVLLKDQATKPIEEETQDTSAIAPDIFGEDDGNDNGILDGLLGDEAEFGTTEGISSQSKSYYVIEEFSKSWKGRYPKDLLQDYCTKHGYTKGVYTRSNPGNGLWHASVTICRRAHDDSPITFDVPVQLAASTSQDAEQVAAITALFQLDPYSSVYRILPNPLKNLWLEWADKKKQADEEPKLDEERKRIQFLMDIVDKAKKKRKESSTKKQTSDVSDVSLENDTSSLVSETKARKRRKIFAKVQKIFQGRENTEKYFEMKEKRKELPITAFRDEILGLVQKHQVIIVSGETGCGKSTQVPQLLAEALLNNSETIGSIICTQPRRISAISIANRVSLEMGDPLGATGRAGSMVGYQIRLESKMSEENVLVFCTTGILLRRLESDPQLDGVSHVIVDEVHERTIESDFLLIILRRLCSIRHDLRVILMSATVNANRFSSYFDECPVLCVPGRTFPVHVQYLEDVLESTGYVLEEDSSYAKRQIYRSKGRGNIEISGRHGSSQRVNYDIYEEDSDSDTTLDPSYVKPKLQMLPASDEMDNGDEDSRVHYSKQTRRMIKRMDEEKINYDLLLQLVEHVCSKPSDNPEQNLVPSSGAILVFLPGMAEIRKLYDILDSHGTLGDPKKFLLIALHSTLSSEHQERVFDIPPAGIRKIVLSTNIAETGVTISDVTVVIDTGMTKIVSYEEKRRVTRLRQTFVAKANALQRRGRAGRVQEGICFHLFTKNRFEKMDAYEKPEILRLPLQETCLRIKVCQTGTIHEVFKEALDTPSPKMIDDAIEALQEAQALSTDGFETLTPLGVHLSNLPVDVHIGKMIIFGAILKCLDPVLTIAAALSFKSPFIRPFGQEKEADEARRTFSSADSDFLTIYSAYTCWREELRKVRGKPGWIRKMRDFCKKNYLSQQNLEMIEDMKRQFLGLLISIKFVQAGTDDLKETYELKRIARTCNVPPAYDTYSKSVQVINAAITAGVYPKVAVFSHTTGQLVRKNLPLYIHPSSMLFPRQQKLATDFVVYNTIVMGNEKVYLWETASIDAVTLFLLASDMDIKHRHRLVTLDGWITFRCSSRTAVLLKSLRQQLDNWFSAKMNSPDLDLSDFNPGIMTILAKTLETDTGLLLLGERSSRAKGIVWDGNRTSNSKKV